MKKLILLLTLTLPMSVMAAGGYGYGQAQGQAQGQLQAQGQVQAQRASATASSTAGVDARQALSNDINVDNRDMSKQRRIPVSSANAPALTSNWDCTGSNVGAVQSQVFGISLGGTTESESCLALMMSIRMEQMGYPELAVLSMCSYRGGTELLARRGIDCSTDDRFATDIPAKTMASDANLGFGLH